MLTMIMENYSFLMRVLESIKVSLRTSITYTYELFIIIAKNRFSFRLDLSNISWGFCEKGYIFNSAWKKYFYGVEV